MASLMAKIRKRLGPGKKSTEAPFAVQLDESLAAS